MSRFLWAILRGLMAWLATPAVLLQPAVNRPGCHLLTGSGTRTVSPGVWIGRLSTSLWNCEPREYPSPDCWNGSARKSLSWIWGPFSDEISGPTASRFGIGAVLAVGGLAGGIGGTGSDRFGPAPALASRMRKGHPATMLPLMLMMRLGRSTSGPSLASSAGRVALQPCTAVSVHIVCGRSPRSYNVRLYALGGRFWTRPISRHLPPWQARPSAG